MSTLNHQKKKKKKHQQQRKWLQFKWVDKPKHSVNEELKKKKMGIV